MPAQGSVIARVFTSSAVLPLKNVPVTFSQLQPDGSRRLLAVRTTNSSGMTEPLTVDTPPLSGSLNPGSPAKPFALVDIAAEYPGYRSILAQGVQVFPDTVTVQNLQMTPLPGGGSGGTVIYEPEQNL